MATKELTAEDWLAKAASLSREGKLEEAAAAYLEASDTHLEAGTVQQAVNARLCAVTAYLECGELDGAADALAETEATVNGVRGVEDHTHETIRTKKLQLKALREQILGKS